MTKNRAWQLNIGGLCCLKTPSISNLITFSYQLKLAKWEEQTNQCPIHRPPHGLHGLTVLDDETTEWLFNTCPKI